MCMAAPYCTQELHSDFGYSVHQKHERLSAIPTYWPTTGGHRRAPKPELVQYELTVKFIFPTDVPAKIGTDQNIVRTTQRSFNTSEKYHRHEIMPLQLMFPVEHHRFEQPQMRPIPQSDLQHMHRHVFFG